MEDQDKYLQSVRSLLESGSRVVVPDQYKELVLEYLVYHNVNFEIRKYGPDVQLIPM